MLGILPCGILCAIPPSRVLIITADIGAGHDLPAQLLADAILASWEPGTVVMVADGLRNQGRFIRAAIGSGSDAVLEQAPWVFDLQYRLVSVFPPTVALTGWLGERLGWPRLLGLIAETRPDVIVSTYPGATELLGRLRERRRLDVPVVSAITDLAALRYWASPGVDRHLIIHEESRAEVQAIAGPGADVVHVRGLSRPEFEHPPSREAARAALGLPEAGPVVVVSGGGWGVGELERATRVVLGIPGATAVCLCGSNDGLRERLATDFAGDPRVRVEGFTERMAEWLTAADVLVHSTAGLTVLEAQLCGTWAISYGWGVGHVRINNHAYERFGLAAVAATEAELDRALRTALAAPRPPYPDYAGLPSAADAVAELIRARRRTAA
jgi:UDP-N-acetylglucosamine:LPS N-acetylglucosamine transferase